MPSVWHCRATGMARLCQPCGKYVRPLFLYMKHPFLLVWLTLIVLCGCTSSGKQKRHVIGLSQCMLDDAWREAMINDMRIEASNYDDVEIIIKDAQNNNETQIQQIRDLIRQKVGLDHLPLSIRADHGSCRGSVPCRNPDDHYRSQGKYRSIHLFCRGEQL